VVLDLLIIGSRKEHLSDRHLTLSSIAGALAPAAIAPA